MSERSIRDPTILPYTADSGERFGVDRRRSRCGAAGTAAAGPAPFAARSGEGPGRARISSVFLVRDTTRGGFEPRARSFAHAGIAALGVSLAAFVNTARSR